MTPIELVARALVAGRGEDPDAMTGPADGAAGTSGVAEPMTAAPPIARPQWTYLFRDAQEALQSIREPSPLAVAHTADAMQMDATRVAGVWMTMIDAMLAESDAGRKR